MEIDIEFVQRQIAGLDEGMAQCLADYNAKLGAKQALLGLLQKFGAPEVVKEQAGDPNAPAAQQGDAA